MQVAGNRPVPHCKGQGPVLAWYHSLVAYDTFKCTRVQRYYMLPSITPISGRWAVMVNLTKARILLASGGSRKRLYKMQRRIPDSGVFTMGLKLDINFLNTADKNRGIKGYIYASGYIYI